MPTDFGARLRLARERRGLSLRQIATVTKINLSALEALEANDPSKLPGGIFSRAFVKAYAEEVGLDPDVTVREFLATFTQEVVPPPAIIVAEPADNGPASRVFGPAFAVAVLAVAAFVGLRFVGWPGSSSEQSMPAAASPAATTPLPITPPAPEPTPTTAAQLPTADTEGASAGTDGAPADAAGAAAGAEQPAHLPAGDEATPAVAGRATADADDGLMRLSFKPLNGPCWVEVVADGKMELSREIGAGETETRAARDAFDIKVGDAGRCTYTLNDRPGRPLGPAGKVVRVRIDRKSLAQFFQGS